MFEKKAQTRVPINDLLASRWSGRAYDPDRALTEAQIIALLEAARWAPSCFGDQPWRYIVCNKNTNRKSWDNAFACLSEGNRAWAQHAPVFILAMADSVFTGNDIPNRWGQYDTGAASMSICLQATDMGLMPHQMGGFDVPEIVRMFAVPERYTPMAVISLGYQLPVEKIPGEIKDREFSERQRRELGASCFAGEWGKPIV